MNEIYEQAIRGYAKILPRDLRDTEVHMSRVTRDASLRGAGFDPSEIPQRRGQIETLFGLTIRIDDNLPDGIIHFVTENEHDRALRRALADGKRVSVLKMPLPAWYIEQAPAPTPALAGLLRHWIKKARKGK